MRDGRPEHLIIYRDDDDPQLRLGARSVGRVIDAPAGLKGAFIELGSTSAPGFLPLRASEKVLVGAKVEVEVVAERRESKGVVLRMLGAGEGAPRLLSPAPTVPEILEQLAPGVEQIAGRAAIEAGLEAEEEAASSVGKYPDTGLDLMVERTRALIAVDLDLAATPGPGTGGKARDRANRQGLREAARIMRLRRWGGLVAIDLIGVGHDGAAILSAAREAFGSDPDIVYGPINRFGVLQLALPWRRTPLEEVIDSRSVLTRAIAVTRRLKLELMSDTTRARVVARCAPDDAALAAPLVARLGPRAGVRADPALAPGAIVVEEG
nr:ribonuclease E/G [Brevundimonas lenta]